jgi:outer membrane protein OmpA-like peptidoglycan-associated protein
MKLKTSSMKHVLKLLPAFAIACGVFAQDTDNLVPNGSFEQITGKLRRLGGIEAAEGWVSPTGVTADLFSRSARIEEIAVPENAYGKEEPKDGDNYAGIVIYSYGDKMPRSYLTAKLTVPMKKGMRYKVSFYASMAELSKYSTNKIGAHISKKPFATKEKVPALIDKTHILHPEEAVFNAMFGWELVCGEYIAEGGERYITIGNFTPNDQVKEERNKKPRELKGAQIVAAYYYIDQVSITLLNPEEACDCGYSDAMESVTSTVYQRTTVLNDRMTLAQKVEAHNVFYAAGKYDVTIAGDETLNSIVKLLNENPESKLKIVGHSDADEYDNTATNDISMKRVEYIRTLLVEKDIPATRIIVEDARNNRVSPLVDDSDDDQLRNAKSRRVSFQLVE